ncbi:MAG: hypothetical protein HY904_19670 [Deltaproteobacteria bacterium]|nr:hypothetical protein [Deltaproteobacteria bacterium]
MSAAWWLGVVVVAVGCTPPDGSNRWSKEPSNTGEDLRAVHAWARNRVLAVGTNARTVANVDGQWRERNLQSQDTLTSLWGVDDTDVFIVGGLEGNPGHGIAWRTTTGFFTYNAMALPLGTDMLRSVHGTSAQDVWAVGDNNTAVHFDGTRWLPSPIPSPTNLGGIHFNAVWCRSDVACWAVGTAGMVARWNGSQWTVTADDTLGRTLRALHGTDSFVLAVGDDGAILREEAATPGVMSPEGAPSGQRDLLAVWSAASDNSWAMGAVEDSSYAVVLRVDGTTDWVESDKPRSDYAIRSIHGLARDLAWAVGDRGTIFRLGN